jgi:tight adherence protein C
MEPTGFTPPVGMTILGINVVWAATLLAAVAVLAVIVAIYGVTTVRDPMGKRIKALNERREQLKAGITVSTAKRRAKLVRKSETTDKMRSFLGSMQMLQDSQLADIQQRLAQAGIRSKDLAVAIVFGRLVAPIVFGAIAAILIYVLEMWPTMSGNKRAATMIVTLILAYKGPDLWVNNLRAKRTDAIRKGLPDAIDLLVICAEAGLTVDTAFARVSRELGRAFPALGEEFMLTSIELGFLTERRQAFENLNYRVNLDNIRGVTTTMIQTEKYGTPLASALRVLAAEFRNERMMRAEEKAARLPAIMTVPLILFILPVLFVVILGPAACSLGDALSKM